MSKVAVIAKIPAKPGMRAELVAAMQAALDNAEGEADTLTYIMHEDLSDPDVIWFYEMYTNQEALIAHGTSDAFKAIGMSLRDLAAGRPELTMLNPIGGKGL